MNKIIMSVRDFAILYNIIDYKIHILEDNAKISPINFITNASEEKMEEDLQKFKDTDLYYKDLIRIREKLGELNIEIETPELKVEKNQEFKVGDRVQFKSWKEMKKEFGCDRDGEIRVKHGFNKGMKHLCNTYAKIKSIGNETKLKDFTTMGDVEWDYCLDMVKKVKGEKNE